MRFVASLLIGLSLLACSDSPLDPVDTETIVELDEPAIVGPSGGTVVTADDNVELSFPAGALPAEESITISAVPASIPGVEDWSNAVELGPHGTTFDVPVTLSFAVDEAALPAGVPAEALGVYTWEENAWVEVPGSSLSADGSTISVEIEHFSAYSVQIASNTVTLLTAEQTLQVGETASLEGVVYAYRSPTGGVYPAAHRSVSWVSSDPATLELTATTTITDDEGRAPSPDVTALRMGSGTLHASLEGNEVGIPVEVIDVLGTYFLVSYNSSPLPYVEINGSGEKLHAMATTLNADGSCTVRGYAQSADPENTSEGFWAFHSCSWVGSGTSVTITAVEEAGAPAITLEASLSDNQFTAEIGPSTFVFEKREPSVVGVWYIYSVNNKPAPDENGDGVPDFVGELTISPGGICSMKETFLVPETGQTTSRTSACTYTITWAADGIGTIAFASDEDRYGMGGGMGRVLGDVGSFDAADEGKGEEGIWVVRRAS